MNAVEIPGLVFDDQNHRYAYNGVVLPSVTQIMEPLKNQEYGNIPEYILETAARRGTNVHQAIEIWLNYGYQDIPEEYQGRFDAFLDWQEYAMPHVIGTEQILVHPTLFYCGTADLICDINDRKVLVDYKTTSTVSDMLVRVQLQAYESALKEHGIVVDEKRIIQLRDDGYKEYIYPANDTEAWRVFLSLKAIHDYIKKYK